MNANELADFLEKHLVTSCSILGDVTATAIITTLRQQQAEIEALKEQLSNYTCSTDGMIEASRSKA